MFVAFVVVVGSIIIIEQSLRFARVAITMYHRLGGLIDRNLFLLVLEPGEVQDQGVGRVSVW